MSIPSFIFALWISTISVAGAILLFGVSGMGIYKVTKWSLRRLRSRKPQQGWGLFVAPARQH